jgi:anaerobic ribonucleoside-triphosphate reductase activating protein
VTALLFNKAHYPVTTLGYGTRAGVWTQGCTIGCPGCLSRDTWAADPGRAVEVAAICEWLVSLPDPLDGVTISGGEPFQQPEALRELLVAVRSWRRRRHAPLDVLVYSGYPLASLRRRTERRDLLALCDAVVAGPYVERLNVGTRWRGSANQVVVPLTELGRERYGNVTGDERPAVQVSVEPDRIYFIGIPGPGAMERLAADLAGAGVHLDGTSWRP